MKPKPDNLLLYPYPARRGSMIPSRKRTGRGGHPEWVALRENDPRDRAQAQGLLQALAAMRDGATATVRVEASAFRAFGLPSRRFIVATTNQGTLYACLGYDVVLAFVFVPAGPATPIAWVNSNYVGRGAANTATHAAWRRTLPVDAQGVGLPPAPKRLPKVGTRRWATVTEAHRTDFGVALSTALNRLDSAEAALHDDLGG